MVLFFFFITMLGVGTFLIGLISFIVTTAIPTTDHLQFVIHLFLSGSLFYIYMGVLQRLFVKIYNDMKMDYKQLTKRDSYNQKGMLFGLMFLHSNGLLWLMEVTFSFSVIVLFVSFFFGFAIKGIYDETYSIRLTKEGRELLYNE